MASTEISPTQPLPIRSPTKEETEPEQKGSFRRTRHLHKLQSEKSILFNRHRSQSDSDRDTRQTHSVGDMDELEGATVTDGIENYAIFNEDECPVDPLTWHAFSVPKRAMSPGLGPRVSFSVDLERAAASPSSPHALAFQRLNIEGPEESGVGVLLFTSADTSR